MDTIGTRGVIALIHLAGFLAGVALYGMLAMMTWRSTSPDPGRRYAGRIPVLAAVLGLAWNVGALVVFGSEDFGLGRVSPWITTLAYAALGFLPAVVVDAAMRGAQHRDRASVAAIAAYVLSATAATMQAVSTLRNGVLSSSALLTLTLGYVAILVGVALATRRRSGSQRALTAVALAAFAVSALHLSRHSAASDSWIVELIGHHASLPLVLVILYQDYRFALADLFLKRALALLGLVTIVVALYAVLSLPIAGRADISLISLPSVLLTAWIATALAFPVLRAGVDRFVDRIILRREDFRVRRSEIARALGDAESTEHALELACDGLQAAFRASRVRWREDASTPRDRSSLVVLEGDVAGVIIPTSENPGFRIEVSGFASGRRLFSDDVALLEGAALLLARRIDELRVARERYDRDLREYQMQQLAAEAELRALRAQLNPHFLFNALTTIGYLIRTSQTRALDTLYQLTALLRGALRQTSGEFITLGEELQLVDAYLSIEQARFEDRLRVERNIDPDTRDVAIPPLILQPLVENAVKHGIAPHRAGGVVRIDTSIDSSMASGDSGLPRTLRLRVSNTGSGASAAELSFRRRTGVGLTNIDLRLARYYGDQATLTLAAVEGEGTVVEVQLPLGAERVAPSSRPESVAGRAAS
jgi:hypothetical protein